MQLPVFLDAEQEKGQLVEAVTLENSSLRFLVKWKGYHLCNAKDEWVGEEDLGCEEKVSKFLIMLLPSQ